MLVVCSDRSLVLGITRPSALLRIRGPSAPPWRRAGRRIAADREVCLDPVENLALDPVLHPVFDPPVPIPCPCPASSVCWFEMTVMYVQFHKCGRLHVPVFRHLHGALQQLVHGLHGVLVQVKVGPAMSPA